MHCFRLNTHLYLSPWSAGALRMAHGIVLSGMTAPRALANGAPDAETIFYYAQRASAGGLLIAPTCSACQATGPGASCLGMSNAEQVNGWRRFTATAHARMATCVLPLDHVLIGRDAVQTANDDDAAFDCALDAYRSAAENAQDAGFDGVELVALPGSFAGELIQGNPDRGWRLLMDCLQALTSGATTGRVGIVLRSAPPAEIVQRMAPDFIQTLQDLAYIRLRSDLSMQPYPADGMLLPSSVTDAKSTGAREILALSYGQTFERFPDLIDRIRSNARQMRVPPRF